MGFSFVYCGLLIVCSISMGCHVYSLGIGCLVYLCGLYLPSYLPVRFVAEYQLPLQSEAGKYFRHPLLPDFSSSVMAHFETLISNNS